MSLSTLAGTTWLINSIPTIPNIETLYRLSFTSNGNNYSNFVFGAIEITVDSIRYSVDGAGVFVYNKNTQVWVNEAYKTVAITGGTDATNSTLIAWFEANATQIIDPNFYGTIKVKGASGDDFILLPKTTVSQVEGLPVPTNADNGKAISVNSSGNYVLANKMANPMTTQGDIIYGGSSGTPTRLGKGTAGQVLTMNSGGTAPVWTTPASGMTNPMTTAGDLIVGGSSGTPARLGIGSNGQVLASNGTTASWRLAPESPNKLLGDRGGDELVFYSKAPFTISLNGGVKCWDGELHIDYDEENTWDGSTYTSINLYTPSGMTDSNSYYIITLYGYGNTIITGQSGSGFELTSTTGDIIHCRGNINTLLDWAYSGMEIVPLGSYAYSGLFLGCNLVDFDIRLPATTLANYCYIHMFEDCTSLTTAPELPATTLTTGCYALMFKGCASLTTAPKLPATTLAHGCYENMFADTALILPPSLPATTLATNCYRLMFQQCWQLSALPELLATTLADYCYFAMFAECQGIYLSATQTGNYQNAYRIPTTGTGTTATSSLSSMFTDTSGTFTGTPTINTTYYTSNKVIPATSSTGGVTSFGGATGAITLGSGLSMTGNQLTLSITSYDGTVIELGYSGNITAQSTGGAGGRGTNIKFGSAPSSNNDYDSSVSSSGTITGDTTYSNETKVYVWGNGGIIINGVTTSVNTGVTYDNAEEVTLTGDYNIVLLYNIGGGN